MRVSREGPAWGLAFLALAGAVGSALRPPPEPETPVGSARVVEDGAGRRVRVQLPFRGTAFTVPSPADYVVVTRRPDTILAAPPAFVTEGRLLQRAFPDIRSLPVLAQPMGNTGTEQLLRLRPSAVIAFPFQVASLTRVGLPAIGLPAGWGVRPSAQAASAYAGVLGEAGRGKEVALNYQRGVDLTAKDLIAAGDKRRPSVLGLGYGASGRLVAWGGGNPVDSLLALAGAVNVADKARNPAFLDVEHVLALDPDVIILRDVGPKRLGPTPAAFMADPTWRGLRAVRSRRVYQAAEGANAYFQGLVEDPLFVRWLAEITHPELPRRLRGMMRAAYREELGYSVSDAELDEMLAVELNRSSFDYGRFNRSGRSS